MVERCAAVLAAAGVLVLGGGGSASAIESASIFASLNADGSGQMSVNSPTNPSGETWTWQVCMKDGTGCTAFANGQATHSGQFESTAGAPPESVFKAVASDGPVATSTVWHGNVMPATPPSVVGSLRANALVTPVAGKWTGGWDGDFDHTQLAACVNRDGTGCIALTSPNYSGCPNAAAVIDPFFTGRYLRVADQRYGVNTSFALFAVGSPYGDKVWPAGPTTSIAVVGQIAALTGPRAASCGPGPPFSATISRNGAATVRCLLGCKVTLRAVHGRRAASTTAVLPPRPAVVMSTTLRLPAAKRARLGGGRAAFTVLLASPHVVLAKRTITIR